MQIYSAVGPHVYAVGAIHVQGSFLPKLNPALTIGVADIKTIAIITHGYLMAFAGSYPDKVVRSIQGSIIHDKTVSTTSTYYGNALYGLCI
jgi:hypothetical protein